MPRQLLLLASVVLVAGFPLASPSSGQTKGQEDPKKLVQEGFPGKEPVPPLAVRLTRRNEQTDEELRKELLRAPEIGFNQEIAAALYKPLQGSLKGTTKITNLPPDLGPRQYKLLTVQLRKPEEFSLPWHSEPDCTVGKEAAEQFHVLSSRLRECLMKSTPQKDVRPDPDKLKELLAKENVKPQEWKTPGAVPALTQLLQAENTPIRLVMVEMLGNISGKEASAALARRALFDLSPEVREKATQALAKRPAQEYQSLLLEGLRYPWPAAADHAAETITALRLTTTVPDLVSLLKEADPSMPIKKGEKDYALKQLVRINHLSNCMLCHAPSLAKDDLIRGHVPTPGEDPPPLYYKETTGLFVRANTTYLRQDFSVVQPVPNNGKWPANQRYDYVLRTRALSPAEVHKVQHQEKKDESPTTYPQRESVLFALRQITKANPGTTYEAWAAELPGIIRTLKAEKK